MLATCALQSFEHAARPTPFMPPPSLPPRHIHTYTHTHTSPPPPPTHTQVPGQGRHPRRQRRPHHQQLRGQPVTRQASRAGRGLARAAPRRGAVLQRRLLGPPRAGGGQEGRGACGGYVHVLCTWCVWFVCMRMYVCVRVLVPIVFLNPLFVDGPSCRSVPLQRGYPSPPHPLSPQRKFKN